MMKSFKIQSIMVLALSIAGLCQVWGSDLKTQQNPLYPFQSSVYVSDDFISGLNTNGTTGALGWIVNGGSSTSLASINGRPGLFQKNTTTTSATIAQLVTSGTSSVLGGSETHSILFVSRLNTNDANTTVRIGAANAFSANPPVDGIFFEKLDADTNWFCVTRSGGVQTRTNSGIAVSTSFVNFLYNRNSSGATFTIGSTLACTHTTNIPTAQVVPGLHIVNSAAASKTIDIDYFRLIITGLAR